MPTDQLPLDIKLREDATLANYIGKAPMRFGDTGVYVVYGEGGSGKSHLLQAVCHAARAAGKMTFYLDDPSHHEVGILDGLDAIDVICLDAIDSVLGDDAWETALFHLINAMRDTRRMLVIAARPAPSDLGARLPDLRSRLLAAEVIETDTLLDDEKLRLLREKANRQGFELSDEVGRFILTRSERSPKALIDLLSRIEVATLARQRKVTIPLVKSVLGS